MRSRLAARLLTGPLAFFLAGVIDAAELWGRWAWGRVLRRRGRAALSGPHSSRDDRESDGT